jgi:hypothetical protein
LKEPLGWVFSSFRRIVQPASVERGVLFIKGVGIQGFLYDCVGGDGGEGFEGCVWIEGERAMVVVVVVMLPMVIDNGRRSVFGVYMKVYRINIHRQGTAQTRE